MKRRGPLRILLIIAGLIAFAFVVDLLLLIYHDFLDVVGGPDIAAVTPEAPPALADPRFVGLAALLTSTPMTSGNDVELIQGEAVFPRLWADLRAAQRSITIQMFYCGPGQVADTVAAILSEKARAGLSVLFLGDGFGCSSLGRDYFNRLRAAGMRTLLQRPVRWYSLHRSKHRSHVRVIVIDGMIGYTGGTGFDDKWTTTSKAPAWMDAVARYTGPAVGSLQAVFATGWTEATGDILTGEQFYPVNQVIAAGPGSSERLVAGTLFSQPTVGATTAERMLALTVGGARRSLHIVNPYFLPNAGLRSMLSTAARRGVDVRIITAGDQNDVALLRDASRATYKQLLTAGVHIYEYRPTLNHAKTFVADNVWSTVGTLNLDARSLRLDEETTLLVHDSAFAGVVESAFQDAVRDSRAIDLSTFERRSWLQRTRERIAFLVAPLL